MHLKNNIKNERGQTMTELALVLPILLVLLFGIIQFGVIFNNYVTLTDAVRSGARKAVVSRTASNPAQVCDNQVRAASPNLNQSNLTVSCTSTWQPAQDVTVQASYPYQISLVGMTVVSGNLTATMKERLE
jgi:Flp pilus assembly protein TadG